MERQTWACKMCTFENASIVVRCAICATPRAKDQSLQSPSNIQIPLRSSQMSDLDARIQQVQISSHQAVSPCPVCDKLIPTSELQQHVEKCLDEAGFENASRPPSHVVEAADNLPVYIYLAPIAVNAFRNLSLNAAQKTSLPPYVVGSTLNRYIDILPCDATRVRLLMIQCNSCGHSYPSPVFGQHTSQCTGVPKRLDAIKIEQFRYINANYIQGYRKKRSTRDNGPRTHTFEYVAAQGPNQHTVGNFLQMIFDLQTAVVVMCTDLTERGKVKCQKYWCEPGEVLRVGGLTVQHVFIEHATPSLEVRRITITSDIGSSHTFAHYWYKAWPDHGVPTGPDGTISPHSAIDLMNTVRQRRALLDGKRSPLLVHCSAGCGRTGTLIGIDQLITAARLRDPIDVIKIITQMRRDRMAMVQDVSQYSFLWQAAMDLSTEAVGPQNVLSTSNGENERNRSARRTQSWQRLDSNPEQPAVFSMGVDSPRLMPAGSFFGEESADTVQRSITHWFQPTWTKDQVCDFLASKPCGVFVVRESSRIPGMYVVSVQERKTQQSPTNVAHIMIIASDGVNGASRYQLGEYADRQFSSLEALIDHFMHNPYEHDAETGQIKCLCAP